MAESGDVVIDGDGLMSTPDELAGAVWRRSSTSAGHEHAVEVARLPGPRWAVRDSKHPDGPVLIFTEAEWEAFSLGARAGEFDDEGTSGPFRS